LFAWRALQFLTFKAEEMTRLLRHRGNTHFLFLRELLLFAGLAPPSMP
jgi:hypothetical protein